VAEDAGWSRPSVLHEEEAVDVGQFWGQPFLFIDCIGCVHRLAGKFAWDLIWQRTNEGEHWSHLWCFVKKI